MSNKKKKAQSAASYAADRKRKRKKRRSGFGWAMFFILITVLALMLIALVAYFAMMKPGIATGNISGNKIPQSTAGEQSTTQSVDVQVGELSEVSMSIDRYMEIKNIGSYTGIYMEDGTDEIASGILMIVVKNTSEQDIQYAEIDLMLGSETAKFKVSTLPAGKSVVLLDQNRMKYSAEMDGREVTASSNHVAIAEQLLDLHEDKLKIQVLDGVINVTNISGEDISGEISVYYKNRADDIYYGGITYVAKLRNGIKNGEIQQIMASHFNQPGSEIMFVTLGE